MSDAAAADAAPKKKGGGLKKIVMFGVVPLVLIGAGVGGGLYAAGAGLIGGGHAGPVEDPNMPKLVKKGEEHETGGGEAGGHGESEAAALPTAEPGGDPYETTYYQIDKDFTSNLQDSTHFVQLGLAVSTNYDSRVIGNVQKHALPIRSAVLMALGKTTEEEVFSETGKAHLQEELKRSINEVLKEKTGFGGIGNVYFTNFIVQ